MSLESATFVADLVTGNPASTDLVQEGDNHIRLIKTVLQNTFPGAGKAYPMPEFVPLSGTTYTLQYADQNAILAFSATNVTVTLPVPFLQPPPPSGPALPVPAGWSTTVLKSGSSAGTVVLDPTGTNTINGRETILLLAQYDSVLCVWSGTEWIARTSFTTTEVITYTGSSEVIPPSPEPAWDSTDLNRIYLIKNVASPATDTITVTLPSPDTNHGKWITLQRDTVSPIEVLATGGTVSGTATYDLADKLSVTFVADGTNWTPIATAPLVSTGGAPAYLDIDQTFTAAQAWDAAIAAKPQDLVLTASTFAWDMSKQPFARIVLTTGDKTLANPTGVVAGRFGFLSIKQPSGGGVNLALSANYLMDGVPGSGANAETLYLWFTFTESGTGNKVLLKQLTQTSTAGSSTIKLDFGLLSTIGGVKAIAHGVGATPSRVELVLECKTADPSPGYVVGDFFSPMLGPIDKSGERGPALSWNATSVSISLLNNIAVVNKAGTAWSNLTNTSWNAWAYVFP